MYQLLPGSMCRYKTLPAVKAPPTGRAAKRALPFSGDIAAEPLVVKGAAAEATRVRGIIGVIALQAVNPGAQGVNL